MGFDTPDNLAHRIYKTRLVFTLPSHLPSLPKKSTTTNRAPLPFQCAPKSQLSVTGYWDEKKLEENHDTAFANQMGRIDVKGKDIIYPSLCQVRFHESCVIQKCDYRTIKPGCCWWGRGVLRQVTRGRCFFGQLNYFIGKRAATECRPSLYPDIDFCKFPGR